MRLTFRPPDDVSAALLTLSERHNVSCQAILLGLVRGYVAQCDPVFVPIATGLGAADERTRKSVARRGGKAKAKGAKRG